MKIKLIPFLLWLQARVEALLERYDRCCFPGCNERADLWCITGGHRHCHEHESHFYNDENLCMVCEAQMTPEERAEILAEAEREEKALYEEEFIP